MISEFAQLSPHFADGIVTPRRAGDRQPQRRRRSGVVRQREAEEPLGDVVGHLIVFRSADAVQKQVAHEQPGKKRRGQGPRAEFDAAGRGGGQLLGRDVGIPIGRECEQLSSVRVDR